MARSPGMKNRMHPTDDRLSDRGIPINMLSYEGAKVHESTHYRLLPPGIYPLWNQVIDMFLSPDEIIELTGRHRRDAQVTQLNKMGIVYKVRADGAVVVLTAHVHKEFDGDAASAKKVKETEPNWGAVR